MVWYAERNNLTKPAEGKSGYRPICVPTLAGFLLEIIVGQLKCSYCKEIKPEKKFSISRANTFRGQRSYACLICSRKQYKQIRKRNPEIEKRRRAKIRKEYKSPEFQAKQRNAMLKSRYGITSEIYEDLLLKQGGVCAICGENNNHKNHKCLHIDHNHKTNTVRGLLCLRCNTLLGLCNEDSEILKKATDYIYRHLDET